MTLSLELGAIQDANVRRAFEQIAQRFPIGATDLGSGLAGTTLPGAPVNGQEFYYVADAANGVVWHLKYRAAGGTSKWECVGGPALFSEVTTATTTTSATYANPVAGSGPSVTVPLAGDYEVMIGALMFQTTGGVGSMSYDIGGTGAVDADSIGESSTASGINGARARVKTGLAASTLLAAKYKTSANTLNIQDRWMRVTPVRVG